MADLPAGDAPPLSTTEGVPQGEAPAAVAGTPGASPKGALGVLFLIVFSDLLGFGIIIPLLPFYATYFHASPMQVALLFSVYSVCSLVAGPVLGAMSDRFGRRPVLVFSQLGSVVGYVLLGCATISPRIGPTAGLAMLYGSRIIDGITGGNITAAQAYISDVTTPQTRAKAMGMMGAAFGIGFAVGPAIGGLLAHHLGQSWPGFAAGGFSLLAAAMTALRLKESRFHKPTDAKMWLHPSRFAPILRQPIALQIMLMWFASMTAYVMLQAIFALFLADRYEFNEATVGWFFAYVGIIIASVQGGLIRPLKKAFGGEWPLAIVGPLFVAAAMAVYATAGYRPMVWLLFVAGACNAFGRSLQTPTLSSLLSQNVSRDQQGAAFGLYQALGSLASIIGPIIAGFMYLGHVPLRMAMPFMAAGVIIVGVAGWAIGVRSQARRYGTPMPPGSIAAVPVAA